VRYLPLFLVALALICIQLLIGGVRLVFSLPAYILLASGALCAVLAGRHMTRPPLAATCTAFVLAAWVVIRALLSPVEYLARPDLLMVLAALLVYLLTVTYFTTRQPRLVLISVFLLLAVAHVVVGGIQFKQADNFMPLPGLMRPDYAWRASGFYICPNHVAGLLEMVGLLALSLACWANTRIGTRVITGYCALMCLGGLAITGSRGGYLSIVFGMAIFAVLSLWVIRLMRRGGFFLMLGMMVVTGALIVGGAIFFMSRSDSINTRLTKIYDPQNMRLFMWKAALVQYHLQPVTGTGSGTYLYYGREFRSPTVQNDPMHVHEDYLELLAEYGLVGAVLCGVFVLVHLASGLIGLRKIVGAQIRPETPGRSDDLALTVGALSAIGALLLHSLVDFNLHIPANALFVAFLMGILARPASAPSPQSPEAPTPAGWSRWGMAVLALVLLGISIRFLPGEFYAEKARVAFRDGHYADSLALAHRGIAWEKKNPALYGYLGDAGHFLTLSSPDPASARMLHEDAVVAYEAGLKLFPHDTGLLLKQAQVLDLLGRFPEAEAVFQKLFRYDPLFANVYAYYGLHWKLQNRMKTAERCFLVARRLGESTITPQALQDMERAKADPLAQSLMPFLPEPDVELPAERVLPNP